MSRMRHILQTFFKNPERLDRAMRFYIHHRNLFNRGAGEFNFLKGSLGIQSAGVAYLVIMKIWPNASNLIIGVCFVLFIIIRTVAYWAIGLWWDKKRIFDKEADWSNWRNPVSKALNKKILDGEGIEG